MTVLQNRECFSLIFSEFQRCQIAYQYYSCYRHLSLSVVSDSATPWTLAHQAPLSIGFPRQEYCGLAFPSPWDLPNQGLNPRLLCLQHCRWILYLLSHQGRKWGLNSVPVDWVPFLNSRILWLFRGKHSRDYVPFSFSETRHHVFQVLIL